MRPFDPTPLFRSTVGFDRLPRVLDLVSRLDEQSVSYPPYNIEKLDEDHYRITMAVAGFAEDELEVRTQDNTLVIGAKAQKEDTGQSGEFLYRGIARRSFERRFELAEHIKVTEASLENGLLHVQLVRKVPEAMKPRTIPIQGANPAVTHTPGDSQADAA